MKQRYAKVGVPIEGTLWDLVSIGRDINGNRTAAISKDGARAKSFQTGGLVQAIHNYLPTGSGARWAAEVQEYIDRDPLLMDELLYLVQIAETGRYREKQRRYRVSGRQHRKPKTGYLLSKTYETWDEEAPEAGDTDDRGYKYEDYDFETLEDAVDQIKGEYPSIRQAQWEGDQVWLMCEPDEDYETGGFTEYTYFLSRADGENLSTEEEDYIKEELGVR